MKKWFVFVALLVAAGSFAQSYSLNWYKISGGGGTSTNGAFAVTGTIGQPDAGNTMNGGSHSVTGGFWSLISVVQTAGSPMLMVTYAGNDVIISWPSPSTGFVLEQKPDLGSGNWTTSGFSVSDNGTTKSITISSTTRNLFFRLDHP